MMPQGLNKSDWERALGEFRSAVGEQAMFTSDEDVALYRDAYSPFWNEPEERRVSAAIAPAEVEQVQSIVRTANRYRIPLYPISTGKNLGYGGSAPNLSGSVVLDLKRMNRVLQADDKRYFAIVEPGVSYFDLYRHIRTRNLKCWIDVPDPGWGSLIGNALDHGVGHTWYTYRDHFNSHCGMEVVLPNGELLRTGMGALPGADTWADFRYGFGPYVDGLFGQGNFGVVTKMGFHLMPEPEAYYSRQVMVPRRRDIIPLTELVNEFEYAGLIGMPEYLCPLAPGGMIVDPQLADLVKRADVWTSDAVDRYAASRQSPYWICNLQFYGPAETVEANWRHVQRRFTQAIPDVRFGDLETLKFPLTADQEAAAQHKVLIGVPNMNIFSLGARSQMNPSPMDGHLLFSPIVPRTGEAVLKAQQVFATALAGTPLATVYHPMTSPYTWINRAFALTAGFPVSRADPAVNRASRAAVQTLIRIGAENGYGEYRTPPAFQDQVLGTYSFNNHALARFAETLKDAIDPNGIIAAGRSGIWPRHMRRSRR